MRSLLLLSLVRSATYHVNIQDQAIKKSLARTCISVNSRETIRKESRALVQHVEKACKLGGCWLPCATLSIVIYRKVADSPVAGRLEFQNYSGIA